MSNRRNYYRILHVQPDAPLEIIKVSYRTLMQRLKQHPDVGGSDDSAALINEAYAVLSDTKKRNQYDAQQMSPVIQTLRESHHSPSATDTDKHENNGTGKTSKHDENAKSFCCFCQSAIYFELHPEVKCTHCDSPLYPVTPLKLEQFCQRKVQRILIGGELTFFTDWPQTGYRAQIRDLSPTGMRFVSETALPVNSIIKIRGDRLESLARVVNCGKPKPETSSFRSIGVEFLTLQFHQVSGTFISNYA